MSKLIHVQNNHFRKVCTIILISIDSESFEGDPIIIEYVTVVTTNYILLYNMINMF